MLPLIREEIMKCKQCNNKITKENQKVVSGVGKYRSKCKPCINKNLKLRYQKKRKIIEESRWF